ncbi:MAG: PAS domain-containing protein, partial [Thermoplasmatota archaeon]
KQGELRLKGEDVEAKHLEVIDLRKQITEGKIGLMEKSQIIERLKNEVEKSKNEEAFKERICQELQKELTEKQAEIKLNGEELLTGERTIQQMQLDFQKLHKDRTIKGEDIQAIQVKLDGKEHEISMLQEEIEKKTKEFQEMQTRFEEERKSSKKIEFEISIEELLNNQSELTQKLQELPKIKTELQEKQYEIEMLNAEVETRNKLIEEMKRQLTEKQTVLIERLQDTERLQAELTKQNQELPKKNEALLGLNGEVIRLQQELEKKTADLTHIRTERDNLHFVFDHMENSIPSSLIIVNNDNIITTWNKKAEELFGVPATTVVGMNISQVDLMGKERVRDGFEQCKKKKEPVTIHSVSLKGDSENRILTNISQIPLLDDAGEFQGMMLVIDDVTDFVGIQTDLQIKQQEITDLTKRFQDIYTSLKVTTINKEPATKMLETQSEGKESDLCILKDDQPIIQVEKKSLAGDIDHIIQSGEEHTEQHHEESTWKKELRICNEIEKCLDHASDDHLKTKKLKDEESK